MYFERSKSSLDSLKSVFNAFTRKPLLGAPDISAPFQTALTEYMVYSMFILNVNIT